MQQPAAAAVRMVTVGETTAQMEYWTLMLTVAAPEEKRRRTSTEEHIHLALDSGSEIHVAPPWFGEQLPLATASEGRLRIHGADGRAIQHYGKRVIPLGGFNSCVEFEVADVSKPLLSVSELAAKGNKVVLEAHSGAIIGPTGQ